MKVLGIDPAFIRLSRSKSHVFYPFIEDSIEVRIEQYDPVVLPQSIFEIPHPISINFINCTISAFSIHLLEHMESVSKIGFTRCKLTANSRLPDQFFALRALRYDPESDEHLHLSQILHKFTKLERLDVFSPRFVEADFDTIAEMGMLRFLRMYSTLVSSLLFENILSMKHLEYLKLEINSITTLPESLRKHPNIRYLDISSNKLSQFPKFLLKMKELRYLRLKNCGIPELPGNIKQLKHLKELKLPRNRIKELPGSLGKLKGLETLDLRENWIEQINLKKLPSSLHKLNLAHNKLQELCFNRKNMELRELVLEYNELGDRGIMGLEYLINLQHIMLNNNRLSKIPATLIHSKTIKRIDV